MKLGAVESMNQKLEPPQSFCDFAKAHNNDVDVQEVTKFHIIATFLWNKETFRFLYFRKNYNIV
jgi:hypothetical protein